MSETETRETCGHTVTDDEGIEGPCDRPATGWRWYEYVEHEPCLLPACSAHENAGGNRMHAAEAELSRLRGVVEAVQALADGWADLFPASPSDASIVGCGHRLRAALAVSSSGEAALPAGGRVVGPPVTVTATDWVDDGALSRRETLARFEALGPGPTRGPSSGEAESGEAHGDDHKRGLYGKYRVERISDPTGKHADCRYFVLDPQHDPHAVTALRAYADACEADEPALAADLREWAGVAPVSSGEADAEVAALRSAVEALADEWHGAGVALAPDDDWGESVEATLRGDFLQEKAAALRSLLASVGSSGEAESGTDRDPADYGPAGDVYGHPEETICRTCGHVAVEHTGGRYSMYGTCPAPVPSGGQADREGEQVKRAIRTLLPGLRVANYSERWAAGSPAVRALTILCEYVGQPVDRAGDLVDPDVPTAHDRPAAARPVLSREALRARLDGHWPEFSEDRDDFDAAYIVCRCGWRYDYVRDGRSRVASWRDHLADVLTAGGEQDG